MIARIHCPRVEPPHDSQLADENLEWRRVRSAQEPPPPAAEARLESRDVTESRDRQGSPHKLTRVESTTTTTTTKTVYTMEDEQIAAGRDGAIQKQRALEMDARLSA